MSRFAGGRAAWQAAGYASEGTAAGTPWDPRPSSPLEDGTYIRAVFTLLETTKETTLPAFVAPGKPGTLALQAYFALDRTQWGVRYGSGKLYERLGMHLVNDEINFDVTIVARR